MSFRKGGVFLMMCLGSVVCAPSQVFPVEMSAAPGGEMPAAETTIFRNPFLSLQEEEESDNREVLEGSTLSAVFVSSGNSYAIIDGKVVRQGDMVGGRRVVSIAGNEVVLSDFQGEYVVYLKKK